MSRLVSFLKIPVYNIYYSFLFTRFITVYDLVRRYIKIYVRGLWQSEYFHLVNTSFITYIDNCRARRYMDVMAREKLCLLCKHVAWVCRKQEWYFFILYERVQVYTCFIHDRKMPSSNNEFVGHFILLNDFHFVKYKREKSE